jgi:hypothetical protein
MNRTGVEGENIGEEIGSRRMKAEDKAKVKTR